MPLWFIPTLSAVSCLQTTIMCKSVSVTELVNAVVALQLQVLTSACWWLFFFFFLLKTNKQTFFLSFHLQSFLASLSLFLFCFLVLCLRISLSLSLCLSVSLFYTHTHCDSVLSLSVYFVYIINIFFLEKKKSQHNILQDSMHHAMVITCVWKFLSIWDTT